MKKMILILAVVLLNYPYLHAQDLNGAIQKGNLALVKALLEKDPSLIHSSSGGTKPLHLAAKLNQKEIAEYLVSKGAVMDEKESDSLDFTPVTWAVRNGNKDMIEMFLKKGAHVQYRSWLGESYLHFAALFNKSELAEWLMKRGIDKNSVKKGNLSPLHIAVVAGNMDVVKLLVRKGANLDIKSKDGGTPLHFAVAAGKDEIVDFLRQNGAKDIPRNFPEYKGKYLGLKEPGTVPEAFAPELFLDIYRPHSAPAFSPDGKEIYWEGMFMQGSNDIPRIWHMKEVDGKWQAPQVASFSDYPSGGPAFSYDGKKLFFFSMKPRTDQPARDTDLWYVERQGDDWNEPRHLNSPVNDDGVSETYPFLAKDGTLYFNFAGSKGSGLSKSAFVNGTYTKPENLGDLFDSDYVDNYKDMPYIILMSDRRKERFHYEMFISFHMPDGRWSKPIFMGENLHQGKRAGLGRVTPDGKHLFFIRDFSFFWVSAKIIEELRPKSH